MANVAQLIRIELPISEIIEETPNTRTLIVNIGGILFNYHAGQYIGLVLDIKDCDERCNARPFSLASSPTEKGRLIITTKLGESAFKKAFFALKPGDKVKVSGPFGHMSFPEEHTRTAVMLSGGIGITPLRAMIKYATDKKLPNKIILFYSNRIPEEILFKEDLDKLQKQNKNLKIIYTITKPGESELEWTGKIGRINTDLIKENVSEINRAIFYICGPPSMIMDLNRILQELKVPPEHIQVENFSGYE